MGYYFVYLLYIRQLDKSITSSVALLSHSVVIISSLVVIPPLYGLQVHWSYVDKMCEIIVKPSLKCVNAHAGTPPSNFMYPPTNFANAFSSNSAQYSFVSSTKNVLPRRRPLKCVLSGSFASTSTFCHSPRV